MNSATIKKMAINYSRKELLRIARKINAGQRILPDELNYLLDFTYIQEESKFASFVRNAAFPFAILFGAILAMNSDYFDFLFEQLPSWTNLSPSLLTGFDYVWTIIGSPVERTNILYHVPNIIIYAFGIISLKAIFDAIKKRNWLDIVIDAQGVLRQKINEGILQYDLKHGHSILFVGKGDFIAQQFVADHNANECITLAEIKPVNNNVWNLYKTESHEADLNNSLECAEAKYAGEYIFFPVQDIHLFLPSSTAYDMPPHRLDLHCQYIRKLEGQNKWDLNPIFIVGDRFHKSIVQTEDKDGIVKGSEDVISIESVAKRYPHVTVVDPTDIVLKHILEKAKNRKIVFRATVEGIKEYKKRFYKRLEMVGYKQSDKAKGMFIVGYDIYEDQIEQQKLCGKLDDYYPVVLSKNVYDALISNGNNEEDIIYVPDLVIGELKKHAEKQ